MRCRTNKTLQEVPLLENRMVWLHGAIDVISWYAQVFDFSYTTAVLHGVSFLLIFLFFCVCWNFTKDLYYSYNFRLLWIMNYKSPSAKWSVSDFKHQGGQDICILKSLHQLEQVRWCLCLHIRSPVSVFIICVMWFIPPSPQARQIGKQAPLEWWKKNDKPVEEIRGKREGVVYERGGRAPLIDRTSADSTVSPQVIRDRDVAKARQHPQPVPSSVPTNEHLTWVAASL